MRDAPSCTTAIAAWITAALAFIVFALLAWSVRREEPAPFDARWLAAFRSAERPAEPLGPGWLGETVRDFTALGSHGVLITLVLATTAFLLLAHRYRQALVLAVAVGSGILANHLLKLWVSRPRPDAVEHLTTVYTPSFPSGHAMLSMLVYLMLARVLVLVLVRGRADWAVHILAYGFAVLLAVVVGTSRIYLGVHWPTDVMAGWAFGLGWALLFWQLDARRPSRP
ncbi:MAG: phosphatase PAP2 family protein [Thioalkalivibrio sp.]|nr:MAG: phosphatase PAP2 family protein [Thioalkalivibrio sp.]